MKLCKDCKHFVYRGDTEKPLCEARSFVAYGKTGRTRALVDGKSVNFFYDCLWHRYDGWLRARVQGTCGKEARFFEPKS